jgi:hypothetical protein
MISFSNRIEIWESVIDSQIKTMGTSDWFSNKDVPGRESDSWLPCRDLGLVSHLSDLPC